MENSVLLEIVRSEGNSTVCDADVRVNGEVIKSQHVYRSQLLLDLLEIEGETTLPISQESFIRWLDYYSIQQAALASIFQVLQVASYLRDDATRVSCMRNIAAQVRRCLRSRPAPNLREFHPSKDFSPVPTDRDLPTGLDEVLAFMTTLTEDDVIEVLKLLHPFELTRLPSHYLHLALARKCVTQLSLHCGHGPAADHSRQFVSCCPSSAPIESITIEEDSTGRAAPPAAHAACAVSLPGDLHHLVSLRAATNPHAFTPPLADLTSLTNLTLSSFRPSPWFSHALQQLRSLNSISLADLVWSLQCIEELGRLCGSASGAPAPLPDALSTVTRLALHRMCGDEECEERDEDDAVAYSATILSAFSRAPLRHLELTTTDDDAEETAEVLVQFTSLHDLSHLCFHVFSCEATLRVLEWAAVTAPALCSLSLNCEEATQAHLAPLTRMPRLSALEVIDMPSNAVEPLVALTGLRSLMIEGDNPFTEEVMGRGSPAFLTGLSKLRFQTVKHSKSGLGLIGLLQGLRDFQCHGLTVHPHLVGEIKCLCACTALTRLEVSMCFGDSGDPMIMDEFNFSNLQFLTGLQALRLWIDDRIPISASMIAECFTCVPPSVVSLKFLVSCTCPDLEWSSNAGAGLGRLECLEELEMPSFKLCGDDAIQFAAHISRLMKLDLVVLNVAGDEARREVFSKLSGLPLQRGLKLGN